MDKELFRQAREVLAACPCENGCPSCVGATAAKARKPRCSACWTGCGGVGNALHVYMGRNGAILVAARPGDDLSSAGCPAGKEGRSPCATLSAKRSRLCVAVAACAASALEAPAYAGRGRCLSPPAAAGAANADLLRRLAHRAAMAARRRFRRGARRLRPLFSLPLWPHLPVGEAFFVYAMHFPLSAHPSQRAAFRHAPMQCSRMSQ